MMKYLVIYEKNTQGRYSAYIPDLPGCTSSGDTFQEAKSNIKEAIELYIEELKEMGSQIPLASSQADICEIDIS